MYPTNTRHDYRYNLANEAQDNVLVAWLGDLPLGGFTEDNRDAFGLCIADQLRHAGADKDPETGEDLLPNVEIRLNVQTLFRQTFTTKGEAVHAYLRAGAAGGGYAPTIALCALETAMGQEWGGMAVEPWGTKPEILDAARAALQGDPGALFVAANDASEDMDGDEYGEWGPCPISCAETKVLDEPGCLSCGGGRSRAVMLPDGLTVEIRVTDSYEAVDNSMAILRGVALLGRDAPGEAALVEMVRMDTRWSAEACADGVRAALAEVTP